MAIKGLSIPVFGKYTKSADGTVTYTDGMINPHAVSYTIAAEVSEPNPFRADNRIVENDKGRFNSGTLTLETDDLDNETTKYLLGVHELERNYGTGKTVKSIIFDDSMDTSPLGVGVIVEHQRNDVDVYEAVFLKKVLFIIPENAATTRGESIEWQTSTITGTISRSDETGESGIHPWKEQAEFESESEALLFLKSMLGVTDTPAPTGGK